MVQALAVKKKRVAPEESTKGGNIELRFGDTVLKTLFYQQLPASILPKNYFKGAICELERFYISKVYVNTQPFFLYLPNQSKSNGKFRGIIFILDHKFEYERSKKIDHRYCN